MTYEINVLENSKAQRIVESGVFIRCKKAVDMLVKHYESLGYIVNVSKCD